MPTCIQGGPEKNRPTYVEVACHVTGSDRKIEGGVRRQAGAGRRKSAGTRATGQRARPRRHGQLQRAGTGPVRRARPVLARYRSRVSKIGAIAMSTENVGSSPPSCCSRQPEQGAKSCRCPCRKWVYGGLVLLILVAGGVAWIAYQQMGGSLRNTALYRVAVQKIQSDPTLRDALGQPISDAWRTAGEPEDMYFDIQGPKGNAKVHAKATARPRQMGPNPIGSHPRTFGQESACAFGRRRRGPAVSGQPSRRGVKVSCGQARRHCARRCGKAACQWPRPRY